MGITVKKTEVMQCCDCFQIENDLQAQYLKLLLEKTHAPYFHTVKRGGQHSATVVFFPYKALTWGQGAFGKPIPDDILKKYEKRAMKTYKTCKHTSASIRQLYEKMLTEACYALSYRSIQYHKTPRK